MRQDSRVALTGGTGFVGRFLRRFLEMRGFEVFSLVRNPSQVQSLRDIPVSLTDFNQLKDTLEQLAPDFVLHLASETGPGRDLSQFGFHYENNILLALTLAKAIPKETKLSLFFGSCEEYGNGPTPFKEEQPLVAFSPYGWGKISAFYGTSLICRERELPFSWLRPFLLIGPNQNTRQLIPSLIQCCLRDEEIRLTHGEQTRDFLFLEDLGQMLLKILHAPEKARNQVFNLGSGVPRRVREVAETIERLAGGGKLRFGALPYRTNEAMSFFASMEKFKHFFGTVSMISFEEGLEQVIHEEKAHILGLGQSGDTLSHLDLR